MTAILVNDIFKCILLNEICSQESNCQQASIISGNGLVPSGRQAITWTNDGPVHWCKCAAAGGDVLNNAFFIIVMTCETTALISGAFIIDSCNIFHRRSLYAFYYNHIVFTGECQNILLWLQYIQLNRGMLNRYFSWSFCIQLFIKMKDFMALKRFPVEVNPPVERNHQIP